MWFFIALDSDRMSEPHSLHPRQFWD